MRASNAGVRSAANGPRGTRPVNYGTIGGEECGEISSHAEDLLRGIGKLLDGSDAVARKVAAALCQLTDLSCS